MSAPTTTTTTPKPAFARSQYLVGMDSSSSSLNGGSEHHDSSDAVVKSELLVTPQQEHKPPLASKPAVHPDLDPHQQERYEEEEEEEEFPSPVVAPASALQSTFGQSSRREGDSMFYDSTYGTTFFRDYDGLDSGSESLSYSEHPLDISMGSARPSSHRSYSRNRPHLTSQRQYPPRHHQQRRPQQQQQHQQRQRQRQPQRQQYQRQPARMERLAREDSSSFYQDDDIASLISTASSFDKPLASPRLASYFRNHNPRVGHEISSMYEKKVSKCQVAMKELDVLHHKHKSVAHHLHHVKKHVEKSVISVVARARMQVDALHAELEQAMQTFMTRISSAQQEITNSIDTELSYVDQHVDDINRARDSLALLVRASTKTEFVRKFPQHLVTVDRLKERVPHRYGSRSDSSTTKHTTLLVNDVDALLPYLHIEDITTAPPLSDKVLEQKGIHCKDIDNLHITKQQQSGNLLSRLQYLTKSRYSGLSSEALNREFTHERTQEEQRQREKELKREAKRIMKKEKKQQQQQQNQEEEEHVHFHEHRHKLIPEQDCPLPTQKILLNIYQQ